jgi:hypothetical protein
MAALSRLQPNRRHPGFSQPTPAPARPIARLSKAALLCLITSAALQQAAATLMAMPKSS